VADRATRLAELIGGPESPKSERTMQAMLKTRKLDIAELERAHARERWGSRVESTL
jgi:hypothetical protein